MTLTLPTIPPFDLAAAAAATAYQPQLTKPVGSLGRLEELAVFYAGARGAFPVAAPRSMFLPVFAADHGVCVEGVSPFPAELTAPIVQNVVDGGAAVSVMCRLNRIELIAIDVGMTGEARATTRTRHSLLSRKVRAGTRNLRVEDAMTREEAMAAISVGLEVAALAVTRHDLAGIGEIGIGNTTASAALIAAFTGVAPELAVGRGAGLDDEGLARKGRVVTDALRRVAGRSDPLDVAAALGGLEILAMAGFLIGAAAGRLPVVIDGVIATAAAVTAHALCPAAKEFWVASHCSMEPAMKAARDSLGLEPLLDLRMRLGEGTGSVLAMELLRTAVTCQAEMATFASAGLI